MFDRISLEEFESRTGLSPIFPSSGVKNVTSLREVDFTSNIVIQAMPRHYLEGLIRSTTLAGDLGTKPYQNCDIRLVSTDPSDLLVGQTFVQRGKYQALLEDFSSHLDNHACVPRGIAKKHAMIIYGQTFDGENVVAHYVPPIIEEINGTRVLLDGTHRNYLIMQVGTTIVSVVVKGVQTPPPFEARPWSETSAVDEKPALEHRFHNLQPDLYRDLKWIGIDG